MIVDTRKTTPGLRVLEKYAVRVGGGHNHRHQPLRRRADQGQPPRGGPQRGLRHRRGDQRARAGAPHTIRVEIEVTSLDEVDEAVAAAADIILLDNMAPPLMAEAVQRIHTADPAAGRGGRILTEASGGIMLETVRAAAEAGVDLISVGALTHSVPALDISLELELA